MQVLFLDIATTTGWCLLHPAPSLQQLSGCRNFSVDPILNDTPCRRHGRIGHKFADWVSDMIHDAGVEHLVVERAGGNYQGQAARLLPGLNMLALTMATANGCTVEEVADSEWKKSITGIGRPEKAQTMFAVRQLGHEVYSTDEADAVAIKLWWLRKQGFLEASQALPMELPEARKPKRPRRFKGRATGRAVRGKELAL